ncbi:MAG TPA: ATP-binding protein [Planctomycetota bacterium]|nr:ATP-binding protein [Planctomycetota bacterium]
MLSLYDALEHLRSSARRSPYPADIRVTARWADGARRSEFLKVANRCWLALGGLAIAALPFYPSELVSFVILASLTSVTFVIIDALQRNGETRVGGLLFAGVVDATCYGLMIYNYRLHGFDDLEANLTRVAAFAIMGSSIVFAGATVCARAAFVFALLNTVLLIVAAVFVDGRLGPKVSIPFFWWLLAMSVWLYERHVARAFAALQEAQDSLELRVEERTRDLRSTMVRLELARKATENANKELESFSYSVAHDLRGPLRRIVGFADILEDDFGGRLESGARECMSVIRGQSKRMSQLIEDLLRLAKVGRAPLLREDLDLSRLAREVAEDLGSKDTDRRVEWVIAPGLRCKADAGLMRVVLENLLGNAWKFTSKIPEARIEVGSNGSGFSIRDNGAGFDAAHSDKLFQPFERLHADSEFSGSGIGLATVARIVKRHGGTISAAGEVGKGATFTFTIGDGSAE